VGGAAGASVVTGGLAAAAGGAGAAGVPRAVPHSMQNFAPGGFSVPQEGHLAASGEPHAMQNFACGGFSVPQLEQARALT
jgi:hypothetical protein